MNVNEEVTIHRRNVSTLLGPGLGLFSADLFKLKILIKLMKFNYAFLRM